MLKISVRDRSYLKLYEKIDWEDCTEDLQAMFHTLHALKFKQLYWPSMDERAKPIDSFEIMILQDAVPGLKVSNINIIFKISVR
jgi:hypothetical protein